MNSQKEDKEIKGQLEKISFTSQSSTKSFTSNERKNTFSAAYERFKLCCFYIWYRWPILIEQKLGFDMTHYILRKGVDKFEHPLARLYIKNSEAQKLKSMVLAGNIKIDDVINCYSNHTMIMEAITLNNLEIFNFLMKMGPHLMLRDHLGQTALHKAASLGRLKMVSQLIEVGGVDPGHTDAWGVTAIQKAQIHEHRQVIKYLEEVMSDEDKLKKVGKQWGNSYADTSRKKTIFQF